MKAYNETKQPQEKWWEVLNLPWTADVASVTSAYNRALREADQDPLRRKEVQEALKQWARYKA